MDRISNYPIPLPQCIGGGRVFLFSDFAVLTLRLERGLPSAP
jgi:hypothetical protein